MKFSIIKKNKEKGFGIIELVMTIVIVGVAIVGILTLMTRVTGMIMQSKVNTIALNLAREGIELIRAKRDSNWLAANAWDQGLYSGSDYSAIAYFDTKQLEWVLDFTPQNIESDETRLFYDSQNLLYTHINSEDAEKTNFYRLISLFPICENIQDKTESVKVNGEQCSELEKKIGIHIRSEVLSKQGVKSRTFTIDDKLYNWR